MVGSLFRVINANQMQSEVICEFLQKFTSINMYEHKMEIK